MYIGRAVKSAYCNYLKKIIIIKIPSTTTVDVEWNMATNYPSASKWRQQHTIGWPEQHYEEEDDDADDDDHFGKVKFFAKTEITIADIMNILIADNFYQLYLHQNVEYGTWEATFVVSPGVYTSPVYDPCNLVTWWWRLFTKHGRSSFLLKVSGRLSRR